MIDGLCRDEEVLANHLGDVCGEILRSVSEYGCYQFATASSDKSPAPPVIHLIDLDHNLHNLSE